jgi:hypothetical protein
MACSRGAALPPNSKLREYVVPQKPVEEQESPKPMPTRDRAAFGWAQRLKRVFGIGGAAFSQRLDSRGKSPSFQSLNQIFSITQHMFKWANGDGS